MAISVPPFRCHHAALTPDQVSRLREEAHALFTAKQKTRGSGRYSAGTTFFIHAADTPRSLAEEYALSVFRWFTQGQYFDPHCAGAEFWPLVLNENSDEVGAHYDKDYAAEAEGEDLYPLVGTVTYLADHGAPTTFFEITEDTTRDHSECSIEHAWISRVRSGKVVAFDGRYLHCAPSALIDMWGRGPAQATPRVTMLVNIWFDPPRDAIRSPFIDESYTPTNPFPAHLGAPSYLYFILFFICGRLGHKHGH